MSEGARPAGPLSPGGPALVAIGGGHGLARSLGAARRFASKITAIVSVADDGGSSGRLREALGIAAPGDLRKCLVALLPNESLLGLALEHRFVGGELDGHAFGNLLIAALGATAGDFVEGVAEACRILQTVGEVYPASDAPVVLRAATANRLLSGQVKIMTTAGVTGVTLEPPDVGVPAGALLAIEEADGIVIGPGSLYTSVLAALMSGPIAKTIGARRVRSVYVCNLREQVPETSGYDVARHVEALIAHGVVPDVVLADPSSMAVGALPRGVKVLLRRLTGGSPAVHDEDLLAQALLEALF